MNNEFGYFNDEEKEYIITTPLTPRPWENRMWNEWLQIQQTNHGTGISYTRTRDGRFVLFNYSYNKHLYIHNLNTNKIWSPSWFPVCQPLDNHRVRVGQQYTIYEGELEGIHASWTVTIHPTLAAEIWQVSLHNSGANDVELKILPYYEVDLSFKDPYFGVSNRFNSQSSNDGLFYIENKSHLRDANDYALALYTQAPIESHAFTREEFFANYTGSHSPWALTAETLSSAPISEGQPIFAPRTQCQIMSGETMSRLILSPGYL